MENAVLSFGVFAILVVDDGSRFKSVFKYIFAVLGIIYWPIAHGYNKGVSVEKYHHFQNKTQEIAGQDRGTHDVFMGCYISR